MKRADRSLMEEPSDSDKIVSLAVVEIHISAPLVDLSLEEIVVGGAIAKGHARGIGGHVRTDGKA